MVENALRLVWRELVWKSSRPLGRLVKDMRDEGRGSEREEAGEDCLWNDVVGGELVFRIEDGDEDEDRAVDGDEDDDEDGCW